MFSDLVVSFAQMTSLPVVFIVGLYVEAETSHPCLCEKIIKGWEMPLKMIKIMDILSEEILKENESGTF